MVANYEKPPAPGDPRATEAWALTQAAVRLTRAMDSGDEREMKAALRLNWQLWTIIQSELLSPNSTVPDDIRSNVLSLSNFIDKHTMEILRAPKPDALQVLININRELAGGLRDAPAGADADTPAQETPDGTQTPPEGGVTA